MTNLFSKRRWMLVALAMASLSIPASLLAATTGTISLRGTVTGVLEITVAAEAGASALDLSAVVSDFLVATVTERSNQRTGYTVTLESANAAAAAGDQGFFKSDDPANTDTLAYTVSYDGNAVSLAAGISVISDVSGRTGRSGVSKELRITYDGAAVFLNQDTYSDVLTLTIVAK